MSRAKNPSSDAPVVVIGASAGALPAIEAIVEGLGDEIPISFVLVQHLSPDFRSHMIDLLGRKTKLPIEVAESSVELEPGHLYLTPPRSLATLHGRRLEIDIETGRPSPHPIDHLLSSIAETSYPCYAIILSGTGSDGMEGVRHLREQGGVILAQTPESAAFDAMPLAAIGTGCVHLVLRPELISQLIAHRRFGLLHSRDAAELVDDWNAIDGLLKFLGYTTGIDFSIYRQSTLVRRIERRFELQPDETLADYRRRVETNEILREQLVADLLISITSFFRDEFPWMALGQSVVPKILEEAARSTPDRPVRIWDAACSTGQEAYSLAMLLAEHCAELDHPPRVQIFATDVSEAKLAVAKVGYYSERELEGVSDERRSRFFRPSRDGFTVVPEIRSMVSFSAHNLITDPPFSNLDLVVCRNLLIYMNRAPQEALLAKLEFGLREQGYLFLGSSEDPGSLKTDLQNIGAKTGIWRKRLGVDRPLSLDFRPSMPYAPRALPATAQNPSESTYAKLLEAFVPCGVLVNNEGEIIHSFGSVGDFVPIRGAAPFNLLKLVPRQASATLDTAMSQARESLPAPVQVLVMFEREGTPVEFFATVYAVGSSHSDAGSFLVSLEARTPPDVEATDEEAEADDVSSRRLRRELSIARNSLESVSQELGVRHGELQAANEELTASNEELQSSNEEIQSVNEELRTVNEELQRRIAEQQRAASDLANLLRSTEVGVVFLDLELRIREFTPAATTLFRMRKHDVGRELADVRSELAPEDLLDMAGRVLDGAELVECSVHVGRTDYLVRVHPYRNEHEAVEGLVLIVVDVTGFLLTDVPETAQVCMQAWQAAPALLLAGTAEDQLVEASDELLALLGRKRTDLGVPHAAWVGEEHWPALESLRHELSVTGAGLVDLEYRAKDGTLIPVRLRARATRGPAGSGFAAVVSRR